MSSDIVVAGAASPAKVEQAQEVAAAFVDLAEAEAEADRLAADPVDDLATIDRADFRVVLETRRDQIDAARNRVQVSRDHLEKVMRSQIDAARTAMHPLLAEVRQLEEQIATIDLFLGSNELWQMVIEGDTAEADEPIVVYQTVELLDEIIAADAERVAIAGGAISADDVLDPGADGWATFDEWLAESPVHLDGFMPARRSIVAARSARENRDEYGREDGSEITFFYFRNGDQVSKVVASYDWKVGDRIIPNDVELRGIFYERRWNHETREYEQVPLRPGSHAWTEAEERVETRQKHFMKIALMLQGVVERTTALSPLPNGFVSFGQADDYDSGNIVCVTQNRALPTGIVEFTDWLAMAQADIDKGQRVIFGHPRSRGRDDAGPVHPKWGNDPELGKAYVTKKRSGGSLYVSYPRTNGWTSAESWVSCTVVPGALWWLPIDSPTVTVESLTWYLTSKDDRRHYKAMIPLMRSALRFLLAEATEEKPFKDLVHRRIEDNVIFTRTALDVEAVPVSEIVDAAVFHYKTKYRTHRALLAGSDVEAFTAVVDTAFMLLGVQSLPVDETMVQNITDVVPDAVWVGRNHDGEWVAVEPADERDCYVHVHTWSAVKGNRRPVAEWRSPPDTRTWLTVKTTPRWERWPRLINRAEFTGPEIASLREQAAEIPGVLAAWLDKSRWRRTEVVVVETLPSPPMFDDDHPLTVGAATVTTNRSAWQPVRTADGIELTDPGWNDYSGTQVRQESTVDELMKASPTRWVYPGFCWDELRRWVQHHDRLVSTSRSLRPQVVAAFDQIRTEWIRLTEAVEYRAFLTKFGNEAVGKWDGHRKLIGHKFAFPLDHRHGRSSSLWRVLQIAVETGQLGPLIPTAQFSEILTMVDPDHFADTADWHDDDQIPDSLSELAVFLGEFMIDLRDLDTDEDEDDWDDD